MTVRKKGNLARYLRTFKGDWPPGVRLRLVKGRSASAAAACRQNLPLLFEILTTPADILAFVPCTSRSGHAR